MGIKRDLRGCWEIQIFDVEGNREYYETGGPGRDNYGDRQFESLFLRLFGDDVDSVIGDVQRQVLLLENQ